MTNDSGIFAAAIKKMADDAGIMTNQINAMRGNINVMEAKRDALLLAAKTLEDMSPSATVAPLLPRLREPRSRLNVKEAILSDLRESGKLRTVEQLCSIINRRKAQVMPALQKLIADGVISSTEDSTGFVATTARMQTTNAAATA